MRCATEVSNIGPNRIVYQDSHKHFRMPSLVALVAVLCLVHTASLTADTTYTVDAIANGLLAAEAKFTDLRVEYVSTGMPWNDPNGPINIAKVIYVHKTLKNDKTAKRLCYQDLEVSSTDPKKGHSTVVWDTLVSFDGEVTMSLDRMSEPMKGRILAGYHSKRFPTMDPHTKVWYFSDNLLGELLKENRSTFHIEDQSEVLDGVSTVKLVGTIWDGVATVKLWVSPERNFLPLKRQIMRTGGRLLSETALYDLIQLPNGLWYPTTIQSPAEPPGAPDPAWVTTYNISEISIEPIPEEFFSPEFPPNTQVSDDILKISYITY